MVNTTNLTKFSNNGQIIHNKFSSNFSFGFYCGAMPSAIVAFARLSGLILLSKRTIHKPKTGMQLASVPQENDGTGGMRYQTVPSTLRAVL